VAVNCSVWPRRRSVRGVTAIDVTVGRVLTEVSQVGTSWLVGVPRPVTRS